MFVARDVIFNESQFGKVVAKNDTNRNEEVIITECSGNHGGTRVQDDGSRLGDSRAPSEVAEDWESADSSSEGAVGGSDSGPEANSEETTNVRRSGRVINPPRWMSDYDVDTTSDITAFALSAEEFVEDIPSDIETLKKRSDWPMWKQAVDEELASLEKNDTWTLVELPEGRKVVDNKWVFKLKRNSDGEVYRYKARLVARGFSQRRGFDYVDTYSPVVKMTTLRVLLSLSCYTQSFT